MRPWPKGLPFRNTAGTAMTWRRSTSSWNTAPSIMVWRILGLSAAMHSAPAPRPGQLWQVSETKVSKLNSPSRARICSTHGVVEFRRIAAGLQQRQHQRGEFMAHAAGRRSALRVAAPGRRRANEGFSCASSRTASIRHQAATATRCRAAARAFRATCRRRRRRRRSPPAARSAPGNPSTASVLSWSSS